MKRSEISMPHLMPRHPIYRAFACWLAALFALGTGTQAAAPQARPAAAEPTLLHNVPYGQVGDVVLNMELLIPSPAPTKPTPVIMFVHGGGWSGGTSQDGMSAALDAARDGYIACSINYRLTQIAPFPAQLQDCKCAVRFLRANAAKYHIDPDKIGVWGASAGGHLVAMLGLTNGIAEFEGDGGWNDTSSQVQAVCDWFGPTDLVKWIKIEQFFGNNPAMCKLLGFYFDPPTMDKWARTLDADPGLTRLLGVPPLDDPKRAQWINPVAYVEQSTTTPPFLIMHGDHDPWVPYQQSIELADALDKKGNDVTLRILLNSGHSTGHFATGWADEVKAFFDRTLLGK
jgi:acetyl esterase/lipase